MSWAKVDDKFPTHRRVRRLERDVVAKWLHVTAICFCCEHLTDGFIDAVDLNQIIGNADVPKTAALRAVPKLVGAGLWIEHDADGCYLIRDFLDYNPTAAEVKRSRELNADRQARFREKHRDGVTGRFGNGSSNALRDASVIPPRTRTPKDQVLLAAASVDDSVDNSPPLLVRQVIEDRFRLGIREA